MQRHRKPLPIQIEIRSLIGCGVVLSFVVVFATPAWSAQKTIKSILFPGLQGNRNDGESTKRRGLSPISKAAGRLKMRVTPTPAKPQSSDASATEPQEAAKPSPTKANATKTTPTKTTPTKTTPTKTSAVEASTSTSGSASSTTPRNNSLRTSVGSPSKSSATGAKLPAASRATTANRSTAPSTTGSAAGDNDAPSVWVAPVEVRPIEDAEPTVEQRVLQKATSSRRPRSAIKTLSVEGLRAGYSTVDDLSTLFGEPIKQSDQGDHQVLTYAAENYKAVEATVIDGIVDSMLITLNDAKTNEALASALGIAEKSAAEVFDETGESLGVVYPECGVVFLVNPDEPGGHAQQIFCGPISGEAFLIRAQQRSNRDAALILQDIEEAESLGISTWELKGVKCKALLSERRYEEAIQVVGELGDDLPEESGILLVVAQAQLADGDRAGAENTLEALSECSPTDLQEAHAELVLGDVYASGPTTDFTTAATHHYNAIEALESIDAFASDAWLIRSRSELLALAAVALAKDVANGDYANKNEVVPQWHERADELLHEIFEQGHLDPMFQLEIESAKVAASVPIPHAVPLIRHVANVRAIHDAITTGDAPGNKVGADRIAAEAYYHAALTLYGRGAHGDSQEYAQKAMQLYDKLAGRADSEDIADYRIACCQFVLGVIDAIREDNHKGAVKWYEKALLTFQNHPPASLEHEIGLHGERLVSMGVSYWSVGKRDRALTTTKLGKSFVQLAIEKGWMEEQAIATPTNNLEQMLKRMDKSEAAESKPSATLSSRRTAKQRR